MIFIKQKTYWPILNEIGSGLAYEILKRQYED